METKKEAHLRETGCAVKGLHNSDECKSTIELHQIETGCVVDGVHFVKECRKAA